MCIRDSSTPELCGVPKIHKNPFGSLFLVVVHLLVHNLLPTLILKLLWNLRNDNFSARLCSQLRGKISNLRLDHSHIMVPFDFAS